MINRIKPFILFLAVIPVLALIIFPLQSRSPDNPAAEFTDSSNSGSLGFLGGGACEVTRLVGFHAPESWGVWSASDPGEIFLKDEIAGRFQLRVAANAINDGIAHPLKVTIGDTTRVIELLPTPKTFELDYALSKPAGKIILSGITPRSLQDIGFSPDNRKFGVALAGIQCRRVDAR